MKNNYLSRKYRNKIYISMSETIKNKDVDKIAEIILDTNSRAGKNHVIYKNNNNLFR